MADPALNHGASGTYGASGTDAFPPHRAQTLVRDDSDERDLPLLQALARDYPTVDLAIAEIAALRAGLRLPRATVHVISDIHGEYKKLRHVINNASGSLRPLVEELFGQRLSEAQRRQLLTVLYYPREQIDHLRAAWTSPDQRRAWVHETLRRQFEIVRALSRSYRRIEVRSLFPPDRCELFAELYDEPNSHRPPGYVDAMIDELASYDRDLSAVRAASRLVRNLTAAELVVAGDLGDRGPRIDRVIDYLLRQPNVTLVWGNHDVSWMGACLGQEALIATVLRFSCRYGGLAQLEEGYGINLGPLEKLARDVYGDDPAERFLSKIEGIGSREDQLLLARMQKAAAVLQFKFEAHTSRRHPDWAMEGRNLLHRIERSNWTIPLDGATHPLLDRNLPTVDPDDAYALSADERACMEKLRENFVSSARLWEHMSFVARRGQMWLRRDDALIFHACLPVDERGSFLSLYIDGKSRTGRDQYDALERVIRRAFRKGADRASENLDADWLWYLWAGPKSPLFGKDRMATFEGYFVADKTTHAEHKNAYFEMLHDAEFCRRLGAEFGMGDDVLVVNGHVPVKVEKGETPLKRGGNAVTIDGAFSEAYGDRGYTLVLAPECIELAEHHHFDSVQQVITEGADIVPKITVVRAYDPPRTVERTHECRQTALRIEALGRLVRAYHDGTILEQPPR